MQTDLIIIGMGPVGAAAANLAGAAGLRTIVIDRDLEPYTLPRAIHFDAEIMRVFRSIGLGPEMAAATRPLGGSVYLGADGRPIRTFRSPGPAHAHAAHPSNLFYQPQLEAILRDALRRLPLVDVHLGFDVRSVTQDEDGCHVAVAGPDGSEALLAAPFVLACDGASSTVRKGLGIKLDDIGFEERWLVVDTFVRGPMRWPESYAIPPEVRDGSYSLMICDPARPATLIPSVGAHRRWEYRLAADETDTEVTSDIWLKREIGAWVDAEDVELIRAAVYRFRALVPREWRERRIFLAGDAAHQTPPFFGQGMCHGIRDAAQLIWKLRMVIDGNAAPEILDSYQIEREPHVRTIIASSVEAGAAVCITDPARAAARDAEFRAIEASRVATPAAMTDVVPPIRSGLIDATGGERLPEFIVLAGGEPVPLDGLMNGRFAVVAVREPVLHEAIAGRWAAMDGSVLTVAPDEDYEDRLADWLAARGAEAVVVRPDRHVYGTARDSAGLHALVERLLTALTGNSSAARPVEKAL